ncbi:MAG TPA: hypothetical protein VGI17_16385 [Solirubrobacterales bacterium]
MRAKAIAPLLAATIVAVLLLCAVAGAAEKPKSRRLPAEVTEQFTTHGTNGFSVKVSVRDRRRLTLSAGIGEGLAFESVDYELPARQKPGSEEIKARIGRLGRIDVRFVPESVHREKPLLRICHGARTVVEEGHFVGLVAFRGEEGFTRVRTHRVAGTITRQPALTCQPHGGAAPSEKRAEREAEANEREEEELREKIEQVELIAVAPGHRVAFAASKTAAEAKNGEKFSITGFVAAGIRHRGRIKEESIALDLFAKGRYFLTPEPLLPTSEAILKPPAPFSGSATYRRDSSKAASWTGDLKIALPGFGDVRLTGHGSHAAMCEPPACGGIPGFSSDALRSVVEAAGLGGATIVGKKRS